MDVLPGFWEELPNSVAALAVLALGLIVLALDPRRSVNRAFAALCVARGVVNFTGLLRLVDAPLARSVGLSLEVYVTLTVPFVALWFVAVYPGRRAWARRRWALPTLGFACLALLAGVALFAALSTPAARDALVTGPFRLGSMASWLIYGLILVALSRDLVATEPGRARTSLALVQGAFAIIIARNSAGSLWALMDAGGWMLVNTAFNLAIGIAAIAWSVVVLARSAATAHAARRTFLVATVVAVASLVAFYSEIELARGLVRGAAYLAFPVLIAYALMRYRLFDIDMKVRWTIRQSSVAGTFVAVFFVVSELAQQLFSARIGTFFGIVAAGTLVFALAPLQRAAERFATVATPAAKSAEQMTSDERREAYRALVEHAWADRVLTPDEHSLLSRARSALGISAEEALTLEERVMGDRA